MPPCDNAQQHVQLMELVSAITADIAVDEDGALLRRAVRCHRSVARLLVGRADRAERLDHQLHAMRPRAGRRVRSAARVGRSGSGPREWTSSDPSELTATESDAALLRYALATTPSESAYSDHAEAHTRFRFSRVRLDLQAELSLFKVHRGHSATSASALSHPPHAIP